MTKVSNFYGYNNSRYLLGKASKFMPEVPKGPNYYQKTRHTRDQGSLQDKYLLTFNTAIYPTVIPGELPLEEKLPETFRILSEIGFAIITELGEYIVYEPI